jgi:hypothetical protein
LLTGHVALDWSLWAKGICFKAIGHFRNRKKSLQIDRKCPMAVKVELNKYASKMCDFPFYSVNKYNFVEPNVLQNDGA